MPWSVVVIELFNFQFIKSESWMDSYDLRITLMSMIHILPFGESSDDAITDVYVLPFLVQKVTTKYVQFQSDVYSLPNRILHP